jgi:[CysO sulfur-carrier protein]-S-L-cysteine hydrolase
VPTFRILSIPQDCYDSMLAQALAELPAECCGFLAGVIEGDVGRVTRWYPLVNELDSPTEYFAEVRSLIAAHKDMRQRGIDVLATFHSHPTSEPVPSRKDLAANYSEETVSLIVSLMGGSPKVKAWWLTATEYREAKFEVKGGR